MGSFPEAETPVQLSQLRCCLAKRIFMSQCRLHFPLPQTIAVPPICVCLHRAPQGGSAFPSPRLFVRVLPIFSHLQPSLSHFHPSPVARPSCKLSYPHRICIHRRILHIVFVHPYVMHKHICIHKQIYRCMCFRFQELCFR